MLIYNYVAKNDPRKNQQIRIELLDRPFVHQWTQYMIELSERVSKINWYITSQANNERTMIPEKCLFHIQKVHDSFTYFQTHKVGDFSVYLNEIEYLLKNPSDIKQSHLNKWHRWFTTLASRYFGYNPESIPPTATRDDLYFAVHDVNGHAHRLEEYTYFDLERRRIFPLCKQWSTQAHNAHNLNNLHNSIWDKMVELPTGTYDYFSESYDHTVWMHEDIQGKDQMKAWLDHDELYHEDITGNLFMSCNVTFDPLKLYSTVLSREDFRKESIACGKTLDRPPLGDIVNIEEVDWTNMVNYNVRSIMLDSKVLWEL